MTRGDIMRMAEDSGAIHYWHLSKLEAFATLVAAAEREACVKVALNADDQGSVNQRAMQKRIAAAIRARSKT